MSKEFQIRDGNLIASFDLENEDGDIDFCKLLKVSHGVADEIGMFVDYVATNKIIKDQSKQIADLEAKLAEKDTKIHEYIRCALEDYNDNMKEIIELKKQLAEKDKELLEIKQRIAEKASKEFQEMIDKRENHNQDKISFAVEQLEKVKELVEEKSMTQSPFGTQKIYASDVSGVIDNQIKQLKEMK